MNIFNLIILDESGSMYSIERQAVTSINETIQTAKASQAAHPESRQFVSLISFSGSGMEGVKVIRDRAAADQMQEIAPGEYHPCGCTPLYDAMGFAITSLDKCIQAGDSVLVTIITDGMENSSRVYSRRAIAELVEGQRKKGWTFAYIGANQDSVEVAREMNITNALNFDATADGVVAMSKHLNLSRERYYEMACMSCEAPSDAQDFFKD